MKVRFEVSGSTVEILEFEILKALDGLMDNEPYYYEIEIEADPLVWDFAGNTRIWRATVFGKVGRYGWNGARKR